MSMLDDRLVLKFFAELADRYPVASGTKAVVVTHLIADRPLFIEGLSRALGICSIIPKPKSVHPDVKNWLANKYPIDEFSRGSLVDEQRVLRLMEERANGSPLAILDIGGYFAPTINYLANNYSGSLLGVVEDT